MRLEESRRLRAAARARPGDPAVAVVAGTELGRRRLADLLEREGFRTVPEGAARADVTVVVDDGSGFVTAATAGRPGGRHVVVSGRSTRQALDEALGSGAAGFVPEEHVQTRLGPTVRAVAAGQLAVPAELRQAFEGPLLTPREKQVLSMVVLGFTNVEIASRLYVAETTVKSHLSSAYRKLGVRSRQHATALILDPRQGLGLGILSLSEAPSPVTAEALAAR